VRSSFSLQCATNQENGDGAPCARATPGVISPAVLSSTRNREVTWRSRAEAGASRRRRAGRLLSAEELDWKNFPSLRRFLSERGKLRSRRITGLSRRQQTQLAQAVKRARTMGLLPYPDQDRSVKAHRAANPIQVTEGGAPVDEEIVLTEEILEVEGVDGEAEIVEIDTIEVIEEPVAVGAADAAGADEE
jgi:small subunit ribosomal protein S18